VKINCAAIPAGLLESELFGHERGAFTGAVTQTMGRFQAADHGTLFLDEIADLPLELQPKLLRVLQEQRFERVGSPRTLQVDVRVIAATNQDLWGMVQERKFRADLYYRLNVIPIEIPPLRERKADIEPLVWHFVEEFTNRQGKTIDRISEGDIDLLKSYHWPGNIRELQNLIERAVIMTSGPDLRISFGSVNHQKTWCTNRTLAEAEREYIVEALRQVDWVVGGSRGAAARLGLPRTTLISRMRKLGIVRGTESRSDSETRPAAFAAAASY
jgi:formate hydrogenlyase transcriptional activator